MIDADYQLFANVVEAGSLSAAGRQMRISPAMVSKRLARLEQRLGVQLVHRTTRKLALTELGERFHSDVVAILQDVRDAEARVTGTRSEPRGSLRVSAPTAFGRVHIAPHLPGFLDNHPLVRLELNLSDDFVDLMAERIDVAVRITSQAAPGLVTHRLGPNRRMLCASPAYLARHGTPKSPDHLRMHRLLARDDQLPWRLTDGRHNVQIDGASHVRTNSSEIVRELAVAGVGIALRSSWDVGREFAAGALRRVLPNWSGPENLAVYAVHPRGLLSTPAMDVFITFLQRTCAPIVPESNQSKLPTAST